MCYMSWGDDMALVIFNSQWEGAFETSYSSKNISNLIIHFYCHFSTCSTGSFSVLTCNKVVCFWIVFRFGLIFFVCSLICCALCWSLEVWKFTVNSCTCSRPDVQSNAGSFTVNKKKLHWYVIPLLITAIWHVPFWFMHEFEFVIGMRCYFCYWFVSLVLVCKESIL